MIGNKSSRYSLLALLLFSLWPFVSFANQNFVGHNEESIAGFVVLVFSYAAAFLVLVAAALGVTKLVLPKVSLEKIANTLGVAVVLLFNFLALDKLLSGFGIELGTVKILIWMLLLGAVMAAVWKLSGKPQTSMALAAMAGVMVTFPAVQFATHALGSFAAQAPAEANRAAADDQQAKQTADGKPNVYWFILDMYTRADVLEKYSGDDNSKFLDKLRERNFFVAGRAVSNYTTTQWSVSATLSMDYRITGGKVDRAGWSEPLQGNNPTIRRFLGMGYDYIHVEPHNNPKTRCGGRESRCIKPRLKGTFWIGEEEAGLLKLTPFYRIIRTLAPDLLSFDYISVEEVMEDITPIPEKPIFVFAHIMSPHPPPRYENDCSAIKDLDWELVNDDVKRLLAGYFTDLRCLNAQLIDAIDQILKEDKSDPIIILQGDHGMRKNFVGDIEGRPNPEIEPWHLDHAVLHALRMPERCPKQQDHDFSLINTFRVVFGCIEGKPAELLPTRIYTKRKTGPHEVHAEELKLQGGKLAPQ